MHRLSCSATCGIFPDQGWNLCLSSIGRWILYHHQGSPSESIWKGKWKPLSHVWLVTPWTIHGFLQARILEWVAIPFSRGISSIQGSNSGLLHCRQILYQLSHKLNTYYEADRRWEREQGHCFDEIFILLQTDKVKKEKKDAWGREGRKEKEEGGKEEKKGQAVLTLYG